MATATKLYRYKEHYIETDRGLLRGDEARGGPGLGDTFAEQDVGRQRLERLLAQDAAEEVTPEYEAAAEKERHRLYAERQAVILRTPGIDVSRRSSEFLTPTAGRNDNPVLRGRLWECSVYHAESRYM